MNIFNNINPIAFEVFGIPIRWYAIFITSAMIISLIAASMEANRRKISSDIVLELFIWCIPLAIVFARIVYVLAHPASYFPILDSKDFMELFRIDHGGITIIGAIFGGILGGYILCKYKKIKLLDLMDFALPFMLLGQALGRWGNYVNQEIYGKVVTSEFFQRFPSGVFIDATNQWHYAAFFYEMILNLIGFAVLYTVSRKTNKRGIAGFGYFIWYGIVRGLMELIREDAIIINGVYFTMVWCFIAAAVGIFLCFMIYKGKINLGNSTLYDDILASTIKVDKEKVNNEIKSDGEITGDTDVKVSDKVIEPLENQTKAPNVEPAEESIVDVKEKTIKKPTNSTAKKSIKKSTDKTSDNTNEKAIDKTNEEAIEELIENKVKKVSKPRTKK